MTMSWLDLVAVAMSLIALLLSTTTSPVDAAIAFGSKAGDRCHVKHDEISFIWDQVNDTTNRFFDVVGVNESRFVLPNVPNHKIFYVSEEFAKIRWPEEQLRTYRYYGEWDAICTRNQSAVEFHKRNAYFDDLMNINITNQPRRMAVFNDVLVNNYGLIVNPSNCAFVRNAGCSYMRHPRIYNMLGHPKDYDLVINLGAGATGTWHFPMECFVALAGVDEAILRSATIHVTTRSSYIVSWLKLLNIADSQITDQPLIRAKKLLVPEMGRCGETFPSQIQWLRAITNLPLDDPVAAESSKAIASNKERKTILLIQRSGSRPYRNPHEVESFVAKYAKNHDMDLIIHSDQNLPPLPQQIERFAKANLIVAPHGAALLFTAFVPSNACIVEFMPILNPECYARIGYLRHLNYMLYTMQPGADIKLGDLSEGMGKCMHAWK